MDTALSDALSITYDAGAIRVPPWLAVVSALAAIRPADLDATIDWLTAHKDDLARAYRDGGDARLALARLPPELEYPDELGQLDLERNDHALRDRYLFAELVGERTFFQAAIYAMTGLDVPRRHAELLDELAVACLAVDRKVWPMAATRRVAARGGGQAAAVVAGVAMMGSPVLAGAAAADCASFLQRARAAVEDGGTVEALVVDLLARKERVMGFGRPVLGFDERVPVIEASLAKHGRADLPYVGLLRAADEAFHRYRGLRSTAAAWAAAILSDLGMTPAQVQAVSNYWVSACVHAQGVYSTERGTIPT